jgi:hypothetical protein
MLGIGGRFVGAKGMVAMPNLANLSPSASNSAILAAGLRPGTVSVVDTSTQSDNDKTFLQSVSAGTLVDLESLINYSYYRYVAPAVVYTLDSQKDTYSQLIIMSMIMLLVQVIFPVKMLVIKLELSQHMAII